MKAVGESIRAFCERRGWSMGSWIIVPVDRDSFDCYVAVAESRDGRTRFVWSRNGEPFEATPSQLWQHHDGMKDRLRALAHALSGAS